MRSKEELDGIIAAGTSELNQAAFWTEYAQACAARKSTPAPVFVSAANPPAKPRRVNSGPFRTEDGRPVHVNVHEVG